MSTREVLEAIERSACAGYNNPNAAKPALAEILRITREALQNTRGEE